MTANSEMSTSVGVIDFSAMSIERSEDELDKEQCQKVAGHLWDSLTQHGFVYLQNHGISDVELKKLFTLSGKFFALPLETKLKYIVVHGSRIKHGYIPMNAEHLDEKRRPEYRECFNVVTTKSSLLPEEECPGFTEDVDQFFERCTLLAVRVLRAIAIGLELEDEDYFTKTHLPMNVVENTTTLRLLNYPPVPTSVCPDEELHDVVRCGEHADYGMITLLFQDESGGLEVKTRSGDYLQMTPIPGTVVINSGHMLDYMTSGKILAARHRVLLDSRSRLRVRKSIAFFVQPANHLPVERLIGPIDNDEKPISGYEFVKKYFDQNYEI